MMQRSNELIVEELDEVTGEFVQIGVIRRGEDGALEMDPPNEEVLEQSKKAIKWATGVPEEHECNWLRA